MIGTKKTLLSWRSGVVSGAAVLVAGFCSLDAHATGFVYQFNYVFQGNTPSGTSPWADVTFQDSANGVLMTVDVNGLGPKDCLEGLYLNLNPADNSQLNNLSFTLQSGTSGVTLPTISTGQDQFQALGDGFYDVLLGFGTTNPGKFVTGDSMTYLISGISGLTSSDFAFLSTPASGNGPFYSAVEILEKSGANGWLAPTAGPIPTMSPIPEPASVSFMLATVGTFGVRRLWLRRTS